MAIENNGSSTVQGDSMSWVSGRTWISVWTNRAPSASGYNGLTNNAEIIYGLLTSNGWTHQATCGVLANLQAESSMNPAQWQIGKTIGDWNDGNTGLGLGQWTPPSKLGNILGHNQSAYENGDPQVELLATDESQYTRGYLHDDGTAPYYNLTGVPVYRSIASYSQATDDPADLAMTWLCCWEKGSAQYANTAGRKANAQYWDSYFNGQYYISLNVTGNGTARAIPSVANANDTIRLICTPASGETLLDIDARDTQGHSFALAVVQDQTFTMPSFSLIIAVAFSGTPPTPPTPTGTYTEKKMPVWMYPKFRRI